LFKAVKEYKICQAESNRLKQKDNKSLLYNNNNQSKNISKEMLSNVYLFKQCSKFCEQVSQYCKHELNL